MTLSKTPKLRRRHVIFMTLSKRPKLRRRKVMDLAGTASWSCLYCHVDHHWIFYIFSIFPSRLRYKILADFQHFK